MPPTSRRVRDVGLCALAALVVALLGANVVTGSHLVDLDLAAVRALHESAFSGLTRVVLDVTELGGTQGALVVTVVAAAVLLVLRHWHAALALVLSVAATQGVVDLIKAAVERDRPPAGTAQIEASGYAFPSAHAATSMALYGLLALVSISHLRGSARAWACTATAAIVGGVGLTRLYLGAHYPTDVVAGWLVGAIIALASWRLAQALRRVADGDAPASA